MHWPRTGVKGMLGVGETQVVCVLNKIRPDALIGKPEVEKLRVELSWKLDEQKMKQIASQ